MTEKQKEALKELAIIECPHRKKFGRIYWCLIYDNTCQIVRDNKLCKDTFTYNIKYSGEQKDDSTFNS